MAGRVGDPEGAVPREHWEDLADHLGAAYLRYSFTRGSRQEVDHLVGALGLSPGDRVLDVGCGPGRHAHELARRGIRVHGVDISERFVELARREAPVGATFQRLDARRLPDLLDPPAPASHGSGVDVPGDDPPGFDAVICLCQGAFGVMTDRSDDDAVLAGIAAVLRPGGRLALSAFNAFFVVKYQHDATFDVATGVTHERTEIRDEAGVAREVDLWTGCTTPRELRLSLDRHGFVVDRLSSVEPGRYGDDPPSVESPEFLVIATLAGGPRPG
jgi:SAM-dependent methyltransferase